MALHDLEALEEAAGLVHAVMPPTPQFSYPLLNDRLGAEVWVKHENHTPTGAFKIRGGLVYFAELKRDEPAVAGVVAATRGNHGQSIAFAAQRYGIRAVIVVPHGNSREKNAAMRARGVELVEHGSDFQDAFDHAVILAQERRLHLVPSYDPALVRGVASCSLELFRAVDGLHTLYVPIGIGTAICGAVAVRDALGLATEIVGVCVAGAPAYAESFAARRPISSEVGPTLADGLAVRMPNADALKIILRGVARVVTVGEAEIRAAMRHLFTDIHNVAEGAAAAGVAAATKERTRVVGRRVAVLLTGGNIDRPLFAEVLAKND